MINKLTLGSVRSMLNGFFLQNNETHANKIVFGVEEFKAFKGKLMDIGRPANIFDTFDGCDIVCDPSIVGVYCTRYFGLPPMHLKRRE